VAADPMSTDSENGAPQGNGEQVAKSPSQPPESAKAEGQQPETQKDEVARLRDQLLRTAADFDNFRKRSRREQDDAHRRGRQEVIKDLLPVFDNLERAAVSAEGAPDVKAVSDGLRIVLRQFVDTLGKLGVKRIPTVGQPFDPAVHEAIQHLASADQPAGVILAEVQPGYSIGDHLVRAAMVVVSKGLPV
jgi:molecular chaperone GrpE